MMAWIKCTDRMPQKGKYVLVTAIYSETGERVVVGEASLDNDWDGNGVVWFGPVGSQGDYWPMKSEGYIVTHWMQYPEPAED